MRIKDKTYQVYDPSSNFPKGQITGYDQIKPYVKKNYKVNLNQIELWYRENHVSVSHKATGANICEFIAID